MKQIRHILGLLMLVCLHSCSGDNSGSPEPHSEADLAGLTVSYSNGSYYQTKFEARDDVKSFVVNTEADGIQAVRQGLADVHVSDEVILSADDQRRLGVKKAFRGEECFDVAFAVRKGNDELLNQLNDFLAQVPLEAIIAHWIEGAPAVEEPPYTLDPGAKPLVCICGVNIAPVSYLADGGEWMGVDPDILRRFAHSMGRPFEMKFQDISSGIIALQTGQCDVISAFLFVTEERKTAVDFTRPYYLCHPGYFVLDRGNQGGLSLAERLSMNLMRENRWHFITDGLLETVEITLLSIFLGTLLGCGVCACRRSRRRWLRSLAALYGDFINGIPTLVLLLIMFYVVLPDVGLSPTLVAVVTFALCFASSAGSIFDTSISSVPRGQTEAGLSLGFTPLQTFRGIVLPQALRKGLPLYAAECVALLKNTSIVGYIAIQDLTRASDLIRSRTFDALIPLLVVTVIYFLLAWLIRLLLNLLLKKA